MSPSFPTSTRSENFYRHLDPNPAHPNLNITTYETAKWDLSTGAGTAPATDLFDSSSTFTQSGVTVTHDDTYEPVAVNDHGTVLASRIAFQF